MKTDRLEQAIHDTVAATAAPDAARLAAILTRLEQAPVNRLQERRVAWPWLLLAAAGAAAAGGGYWIAHHSTAQDVPAVSVESRPTPDTAPPPSASSPATSPATPGAHGEGDTQTNPAIIYRR